MQFLINQKNCKEELSVESDGMNDGGKNGLFDEATEYELWNVEIKNWIRWPNAKALGLASTISRRDMGLGTKR